MKFGKKKKEKDAVRRTPWVDPLVDEEYFEGGSAEESDTESSQTDADKEDLNTDPSETDAEEEDPAAEPSETDKDKEDLAAEPSETDTDKEDPATAPSETDSDEEDMDIDSEHRKETSEEKAEKRRKRKSKMTIFSKISVFLLIVSCIMLLVFLGTRHMIAMIASVVQIAGILIALLFHKKILKSERKWLNRGTILLAVILLMAANIALSIRAYTHSRDSSSANEEVQSTSQNSAELIRMPLGTDDCIGQSYSDVYRELKDAGFTNVDCLAMEDLSFEETEQVGTVLSVRIGSETGFVQDQEYAKDSIILVYYHDYKKCNLTVSIKFDGNLLFNKDDVDLYLNDSLKGTLEHGKDAEFSFREKTGEIVLRFEKTDDAEVSQEYTLNLTSDTDLTLEISCDKQGVYIEEKSIEESENDTDAEDGADSITRSQTDDVAEEAEE